MVANSAIHNNLKTEPIPRTIIKNLDQNFYDNRPFVSNELLAILPAYDVPEFYRRPSAVCLIPAGFSYR